MSILMSNEDIEKAFAETILKIQLLEKNVYDLQTQLKNSHIRIFELQNNL